MFGCGSGPKGDAPDMVRAAGTPRQHAKPSSRRQRPASCTRGTSKSACARSRRARESILLSSIAILVPKRGYSQRRSPASSISAISWTETAPPSVSDWRGTSCRKNRLVQTTIRSSRSSAPRPAMFVAECCGTRFWKVLSGRWRRGSMVRTRCRGQSWWDRRFWDCSSTVRSSAAPKRRTMNAFWRWWRRALQAFIDGSQ